MTQTPQQTKRITSWPRLIGLLLLLVVIIVGGSIGATVALSADPAVEPERYVGVSFVGSAAGELVAVALLVWVLRRQGVALRHIGLGRPTTGVAVAAGIALAVAYAAITAAGVPAVVHSAFAVTGLKLLTVVTTVLIVGVVEEIIFRGYLITAVASMGHGRFVQVLASGVAFGLAHPTAPINMAELSQRVDAVRNPNPDGRHDDVVAFRGEVDVERPSRANIPAVSGCPEPTPGVLRQVLDAAAPNGASSLRSHARGPWSGVSQPVALCVGPR